MATDGSIPVYMGEGGPSFPCDAVRVRVHPSVTVIPGNAFCHSQLKEVELHDGIESIEQYAFSYCHKFSAFRTPPLVTLVSKGVFAACNIFSLELNESTVFIDGWAFSSCHSLRNIAFPPNAEIHENAFSNNPSEQSKDLKKVFGLTEQIINAVKHRFDNLPIHKMLYYQSYQPVTLDQLNSAINMRSGQSRSLRAKLNPTGKQQDCLGMTPLHILACSTVQNLQLYKVLIEKYPETLITEDRWGALPLLYAVWGNAPSEVIQYLVERYLSIYSNYEFNWNDMVETLMKANAPKETIQNLLEVRKESFPSQLVRWNTFIERAVTDFFPNDTFIYLVQSSIATRIDAIGLKLWRDDISHIHCRKQHYYQYHKRREYLVEVETKLVHYETEYHKLKEATSILELALWKHKMNDLQGKKRKRDEAGVREQSRISCGADIVIEHMLPYLLPATQKK